MNSFMSFGILLQNFLTSGLRDLQYYVGMQALGLCVFMLIKNVLADALMSYSIFSSMTSGMQSREKLE